MKVNIGLCLVGVVIGEFIGARQGLGFLIIYSSQIFKLDWMILSIILLCIIAMILYQASVWWKNGWYTPAEQTVPDYASNKPTCILT